MLIVFDDQKEFREDYAKFLPKMGVDMEILECETKDSIRGVLKDIELMKRVKILVFDLSTSSVEVEKMQFDILDDINNAYKHFSIPIFIHSAFADKIDPKYDNLGTLFKIKKSNNSVELILNKIALFHECGFIDVFSPGGYLESEIHKEIHKAFNQQFVGDEIENIILSIKHAIGSGNLKERTKSVFERIAIRSLYQNLISAKHNLESTTIDEIKINNVEHYYRRRSDFPIWTGDIFEKSNDNSQVIIITPRCDINNGICKDRFLACSVNELDKNLKTEIVKDSNKFLTDNPQRSGIKSRFLIPAPNYRGGKVDLTEYFFLEKNDFINEAPNYKYLISLSDELTNEIVRKFTSYILRGGISQSEISEAAFYSMTTVDGK